MTANGICVQMYIVFAKDNFPRGFCRRLSFVVICNSPGVI